jgi:hypothetical protein
MQWALQHCGVTQGKYLRALPGPQEQYTFSRCACAPEPVPEWLPAQAAHLMGERFVYINMRKAGSSTASALLGEFYGARVCGVRNIELPYVPWRDNPHGERLVIGSYRNPWDQYVSLWAKGIVGGGLLKSQRRFWGLHYGKDTEDASAFRSWLEQLLVRKPPKKARRALRKMRELDMGLMTQRYITTYFSGDYARQLAAAHSFDGVVDVWLEADGAHPLALPTALAAALERVGVHCEDNVTRCGQSPKPGQKKVEVANGSSHPPWQAMYDERSSCLVQHKDRWVVAKFNFSLQVPEERCRRLLGDLV